MKKAYVVLRCAEYEGCDLEGVFSSYERALRYVERVFGIVHLGRVVEEECTSCTGEKFRCKMIDLKTSTKADYILICEVEVK